MLTFRSLALCMLTAGAVGACVARVPTEASRLARDSAPEVDEAPTTSSAIAEVPRALPVGPLPAAEALELDQNWVAANFSELGPNAHAIELPLANMLESVQAWAHEELEEAYLDAIDSERGVVRLQATPLDATENLLLVELSWGAFDQAYLLVDAKGERIGPAVQGTRMRAFVSDVAGDGTKELIVRQIHEMAMSSYPVTWTVYTAGAKGLRKAVQVAKSHSEGSKTERWMMLNHVTFPGRKSMVVETLIFDYEDDPEMYMSAPPPGGPAKLGERVSYSFDASAGVFVLE